VIERLFVTVLLIAVGTMAYRLLAQRFMRRASTATAARGRALILYFRSDACPPCVAQWRFLEQVQREFGDALAIEKIDIERDHEQATMYGIFTLPTTLVVGPDGAVRFTNFGLTPARKLSAQVAQLAILDD
jgi:thiol-disulfide isomerase/thioredoxin